MIYLSYAPFPTHPFLFSQAMTVCLKAKFGRWLPHVLWLLIQSTCPLLSTTLLPLPLPPPATTTTTIHRLPLPLLLLPQLLSKHQSIPQQPLPLSLPLPQFVPTPPCLKSHMYTSVRAIKVLIAPIHPPAAITIPNHHSCRCCFAPNKAIYNASITCYHIVMELRKEVPVPVSLRLVIISFAVHENFHSFEMNSRKAVRHS